VRAGADITARDKDGWTPLIFAAEYNKNPEVILAVLKSGGDANAKNNGGMTAFDYAQGRENLKGTVALKRLEEATRVNR